MDGDLRAALDDLGDITVVVTPGDQAEAVTGDVLHHLAGEKEMYGVYVTVNRPVTAIDALMAERDVPEGKVFFVDAVSAESGDTPERDDTIFLGSPRHLTDISIAMGDAVRELPGPDRFAMFDSISTLTVYNETGTVSRFAHYLTSKMRAWEVTGVILSLPADTDDTLLAQLSQFADNVIRLD